MKTYIAIAITSALFGFTAIGASPEREKTPPQAAQQQCSRCNGRGYFTCDNCNGTGKKNGSNCPTCNGRGKYDCTKCNGTGKTN